VDGVAPERVRRVLGRRRHGAHRPRPQQAGPGKRRAARGALDGARGFYDHAFAELFGLTATEIDAMPWWLWRERRRYVDLRLGVPSDDDGEEWGDDDG
jgi:hypothetical protein